jgi:rhodanese-related sulfurtransferase
MKPPISFGLKTAIIIGLSVGLALAFNATRPDRLPLLRDPQSAGQADVQRGEISLADATLLFHSSQAVFVDAREAGEYAAGHINGAIPLDTVSFGQNYLAFKERLEKAATIVTYCDGEFCELSHELADQLRSMGLKDVRVLRNGWSLWRDQGLPTATGEAQTTPLEATPEGLEPVASQTDNATAQDRVGSGPTDMPQQTEPSENMSTDAAPDEPEQTNQTLQAAPSQQPTPEPEQLPAAPQKPAPLEPAPLEPATQEPTTPESAPLELNSPDPKPVNPAPLEKPAEEPHDMNQPASQNQGEQS